MKKLINIIRYIKSQSIKVERDNLTLAQIKIGQNSSIEYPFHEIKSPFHIEIGINSSIGRNAWLGYYGDKDETFASKLIIKDNVRIGNYACITFTGEVIIEEGCLFSDYVYISDHSHGLDPESTILLKKQPLIYKGRVVIGKNCFLGMRATILPNVELGNNCIVGAHSVVTKSFPPYSMLAGAPAVVIKRYSFINKKWESVK